MLVGSTSYCDSGSGFSWNKHRLDLMLGFIISGQTDEAEKLFQAALDEATKGFGAKDPHVASSCNNLAELYRVKKAYEKAEPLYLKAINILEDTFGADDVRYGHVSISVGAALHNLGQFYLALRKLEQARKCYEVRELVPQCCFIDKGTRSWLRSHRVCRYNVSSWKGNAYWF
ncbi:hypothetical protein BHE74_00031027 [Ensete ventricosum]|nr:hypothetical protein BHE74_00031027 [Ensete ventricosum]